PRPAVVAFLGVTACRAAFGRPGAKLGRQWERLGESVVWVLPSPSGLNAHYQLAGPANLCAEWRVAAEREPDPPSAPAPRGRHPSPAPARRRSPAPSDAP